MLRQRMLPQPTLRRPTFRRRVRAVHPRKEESMKIEYQLRFNFRRLLARLELLCRLPVMYLLLHTCGHLLPQLAPKPRLANEDSCSSETLGRAREAERGLEAHMGEDI